MSALAPLDGGDRIVRRTPCLVAAGLSTLTVVVLLPVWVVAAVVTGGAGLVLMARAESAATWNRAVSIVSFALGSAVGPIVYLLLAAIVAISG